MASKSNIVYGYGFYLNFQIKTKDIVEFIKRHKDSFCKSDDEKEAFNVLEDTDKGIYSYTYADEFFDDYNICCDYSNFCGIGAVISNVIQRETGIFFSYQREFDDVAYSAILLPESLPWGFNKTELNLTQDKVDEILISYMKELNVDIKPDYVHVEYFS